MTDLNKLADLIKNLEPFEDKRAGSLRIGVDEVRQILTTLRQAGKMREAGQTILDTMSDAYTAGNGRRVGIQAGDGEKCWIVHSDQIEYLRSALKAEGE